MCCVSKQSVNLGVLSWLFLIEGFFFFPLLGETISPRFHTSNPRNLRFWLRRTTRGLLDLTEESGFWGMFNKMLPNWELPTGRLTSHFGSECRWKLQHSLFCTNCSENSPTEGPLDNCLTPQMTGLRCACCNHAEKQTRQRGICSGSTAVLAQCRVEECWIALLLQMRPDTVRSRRPKTGSSLEGQAAGMWPEVYRHKSRTRCPRAVVSGGIRSTWWVTRL